MKSELIAHTTTLHISIMLIDFVSLTTLVVWSIWVLLVAEVVYLDVAHKLGYSVDMSVEASDNVPAPCPTSTSTTDVIVHSDKSQSRRTKHNMTFMMRRAFPLHHGVPSRTRLGDERITPSGAYTNTPSFNKAKRASAPSRLMIAKQRKLKKLSFFHGGVSSEQVDARVYGFEDESGGRNKRIFSPSNPSCLQRFGSFSC